MVSDVIVYKFTKTKKLFRDLGKELFYTILFQTRMSNHPPHTHKIHTSIDLQLSRKMIILPSWLS